MPQNAARPDFCLDHDIDGTLGAGPQLVLPLRVHAAQLIQVPAQRRVHAPLHLGHGLVLG